MTEPLPRDDVIELLNRLGSDRDEDALEAARELHARVTAADTTWEELLVPEGGGADDAFDADDYDAESPDLEDEPAESTDEPADEPEDEPEDEPADEPAGKAGAKNAESMALIDQLMAKSNISSDLREELEGYKTDIAEGEFEERDRRYLRAVHKRLSKRR